MRPTAATAEDIGLFTPGVRVAHPGATRDAPAPAEDWQEFIEEAVERADALLRKHRNEEFLRLVAQLSRFSRHRDRRVVSLFFLRCRMAERLVALGREAEAAQMVRWLDRNYGPTFETCAARTRLAALAHDAAGARQAARYAALLASSATGVDLPSFGDPDEVAAAEGRFEAAGDLPLAPAEALDAFEREPTPAALETLFARLRPDFSRFTDRTVDALQAYAAASDRCGRTEQALMAARQGALMLLRSRPFGEHAASGPTAWVDPALLQEIASGTGGWPSPPFLTGWSLISLVKAGAILQERTPMQLGIMAESAEKLTALLRDSENFRLRRADPFMVTALHRSGAAIEVFVHRLEGGALIRSDGQSTWRNAPFGLDGADGSQPAVPQDPIAYLNETYGARWLQGAPVDDLIDACNVTHRHERRPALRWIGRIAEAHRAGDAAALKNIVAAVDKVFLDFGLTDGVVRMLESRPRS